MVEGVGVQPDNPPLAWEAWDGEAWTSCEVDHDDTGGLSRSGEVVLHLPASHVESVVARIRAGWFRAIVPGTVPGQPRYETSPLIEGVRATTAGGSTRAVNASLITDETVGTANGLAGGRYVTQHAPIVATDEPLVVEIAEPGGSQQWHQVDSFAESGPEDLHFTLDAVKGEISFGPAVRLADGSLRNFGRVPRAGADVRIPEYRAGGGSRGNVMERTLTVLVDRLPAVGRVENLHQAVGGSDGESVEAAKVRAPLLLRTRDRAVTIEDFEEIAREAAADIARVRAVPVYGAGAAAVRVLVVPAVPLDDVRVRFDWLDPSDSSLAAIAARLDEARLVGTRVIVEPPVYRAVSVEARIRARAKVSHPKLLGEALTAIYTYLHPTIGGPDSNGWPFGRPVLAGDVYAVLRALPGTDFVEEVHVRGVDPTTREVGPETERLLLEENALVFSYEHQVMIE
jgi:predicted phage baseplate assembly protein